MDNQELQDIPDRQLILRSSIYQLLATGFTYPCQEIHTRLADGSFAREIRRGLEACAPELADDRTLSALHIDMPFTSFEAAYLSAFETDMPQPSVSLYEGSYVQKNDRAWLLLEIKGFYRNFGLQMAAEVNDLEDTLTAELEFMQFLTAKLVQAQQDNDSPNAYLLAQRDFLSRHLALWLPALNVIVKERCITPFYIALTDLTDKFVARDMQFVHCLVDVLGISPKENKRMKVFKAESI